MSNAFYSLWLDERMVYSCAYFMDPGDNLDTAQERKLDYRTGESEVGARRGAAACFPHAIKIFPVIAEETPWKENESGRGYKDGQESIQADFHYHRPVDRIFEPTAG
jgi:cyclopropane-fatty-acyl-phospholipid synthase